MSILRVYPIQSANFNYYIYTRRLLRKEDDQIQATRAAASSKRNGRTIGWETYYRHQEVQNKKKQHCFNVFLRNVPTALIVGQVVKCGLRYASLLRVNYF